MAGYWSFTEDRQWARSVLKKNWDASQSLSWYLEVRSEDVGGGSVRLGEMVIRGGMDGVLTLSTGEQDGIKNA